MGAGYRMGEVGRREGQRVEKHPGLYPQQCKAAQFCFRGKDGRYGEVGRGWAKGCGGRKGGGGGKGSGTAVGRKKRAREAAIF